MCVLDQHSENGVHITLCINFARLMSLGGFERVLVGSNEARHPCFVLRKVVQYCTGCGRRLLVAFLFVVVLRFAEMEVIYEGLNRVPLGMFGDLAPTKRVGLHPTVEK